MDARRHIAGYTSETLSIICTYADRTGLRIGRRLDGIQPDLAVPSGATQKYRVTAARCLAVRTTQTSPLPPARAESARLRSDRCQPAPLPQATDQHWTSSMSGRHSRPRLDHAAPHENRLVVVRPAAAHHFGRPSSISFEQRERSRTLPEAATHALATMMASNRQHLRYRFGSRVSAWRNSSQAPRANAAPALIPQCAPAWQILRRADPASRTLPRDGAVVSYDSLVDASYPPR